MTLKRAGCPAATDAISHAIHAKEKLLRPFCKKIRTGLTPSYATNRDHSSSDADFSVAGTGFEPVTFRL